MKIGFFGGSFNPPSNIHINLASALIKKFNLDKIAFVPVGDYYQKQSLISSKYRLDMLKLAIENKKNMFIEEIAINSKEKLYAIDTFKLIKEKYNNDDIFFIMGSDNFRNMPTWKDYENLISNYRFIIIERERKQIRKNIEKNNILAYIPNTYEKIDSTKIRERIKCDENVEEILDKNVIEYIKSNNLYK